jgi:leucyl-tRNA synthetase
MYNHYYDEKLQKAMPITDPSTQQRLAYVDYKPINRCPKCMTGLANEDLDDGKCERCGSEVEQKPMKQRVLRITKYADRLLQGLNDLQRDESMKDLERNRIGKSEGTQFDMVIASDSHPTLNPLSTNVDSPLHGEGIDISNQSPLATEWRGVGGEVTNPLKFSVYTTRIDTVFGMSFVAIAPEHPLLKKILNSEF